MEKGSLKSFIVLAIVLALYLLLSFLIPFHRNCIFWWSFTFSLLAFALAAVALYIGFVKQPDVKSKFYGFPVLRIAATYLVFQLALGLVFTLLGRWIPAWLAISVYAIALAAASIGLVIAEAVVEQVKHQETKLVKDVSFMRGLQAEVHRIKNMCDEPAASKAIARLCESLRYSDPVGCEALHSIEQDLSGAVDKIRGAVEKGDSASVEGLCAKFLDLLEERNRLCRLNK